MNWDSRKVFTMANLPFKASLFLIHILLMEITPSNELPVVWFLAVAWMNIWSTRKSTRRLEYYKVRADLEAKVSLLRETRFSIAAARVGEFINRL